MAKDIGCSAHLYSEVAILTAFANTTDSCCLSLPSKVTIEHFYITCPGGTILMIHKLHVKALLQDGASYKQHQFYC